MNKLEYDDCLKMRETELPHERLLSPLPDTTKETNTDFVVINVEGRLVINHIYMISMGPRKQ